MKTSIVYRFEPTDPPREFIETAISQLCAFFIWDVDSKSFAKGPDGPSLKVLSKVLGMDGFTEQDVRTLAAFLKDLALRAEFQYKDVAVEDAPWKASVLSAATAGRKTADDLLALFYSLAPNLKPIAGEPAAEPAQKPVTSDPPPVTTAAPNSPETKP